LGKSFLAARASIQRDLDGHAGCFQCVLDVGRVMQERVKLDVVSVSAGADAFADTGLVPQEKQTARAQDAVKLVEERRERMRWGVDDRVPGQYAMESSVIERERLEVRFQECDIRVGRSGVLEHGRGQVDTGRGDCVVP